MMPPVACAPPPLAQLRDIALFLDLDGTIAPFAASPAAVGPEAARNLLLHRLHERLEGRLAVVSGRTIADIDRILSGSVTAAAGVHGLERRAADGSRHSQPAHPGLGAAQMAFGALAETEPGLLLETKGHSVALHYRGAPRAQAAVRTLARRLAAQTGLVLQEGVLVAELRTPGPDKGDAIRAFMGEPPFRGARAVFIGDDLTDEHGFAAAAALGGNGILVGPPRPTGAAWRLDDVNAVLDWLKGVAS
jgi:trehalose 6-phosphate phosphatase